MTLEYLKNLKNALELEFKNCGGCETCGRFFEGQEPLSFSGEALHELVVLAIQGFKVDL